MRRAPPNSDALAVDLRNGRTTKIVCELPRHGLTAGLPCIFFGAHFLERQGHQNLRQHGIDRGGNMILPACPDNGTM